MFSNVPGQPDGVITILGGVGVPNQTYRRKYAYVLPGLLDTVAVAGPAGVTFVSRKYGYNTGRGALTSIALGGRTTSFTLDGTFKLISLKYPALDTVGTGFGNLGLRKGDRRRRHGRQSDLWGGPQPVDGAGRGGPPVSATVPKRCRRSKGPVL